MPRAQPVSVPWHRGVPCVACIEENFGVADRIQVAANDFVLESHLNVAVRRFYPQFTVIEGTDPNQETGCVSIAKVLMNIGLHVVQENER